MIIRNTNVWYVRWYLTCVEAICKFLHKDEYFISDKIDDIVYRNGTNLCQMLRTIIIGSLVIVFNYAMIGVIFYSLVIFPLITFPFDVLIVVLSVGSFFALCFLVLALAHYGFLVFSKIANSIENIKNSDNIVLSYISGIKHKYCPMIKFKRNN